MQLITILQIVVVFLVVTLLEKCESRRRRRDRAVLRYRDCGMNPDRPIFFMTAEANPMPIVIPGTLRLGLHGNITSDLPQYLSVDVTVMKYVFGIQFVVPCIASRIGSCLYEDVCPFLERFTTTGCPRVLARHNIPCTCPFRAGEVHIENLAINLPRVSGVAGMIIPGDYEVQARVLGANNVELGCLELNFSMKKRNRGWFFRI